MLKCRKFKNRLDACIKNCLENRKCKFDFDPFFNLKMQIIQIINKRSEHKMRIGTRWSPDHEPNYSKKLYILNVFLETESQIKIFLTIIWYNNFFCKTGKKPG